LHDTCEDRLSGGAVVYQILYGPIMGEIRLVG
jgi:hypothetical protein